MFVRDTKIVSVEDHVTSLHEMRSDELTGHLGPLLASALSSLAALTAAQLIDGSASISWASVVQAGALLFLLAVVGTIGIQLKLAQLRTQSTWAKDLASRLWEIYR